MPISLLSVPWSITFHFQRRNSGSIDDPKKNDMIYDAAQRWMKGYIFDL